MIQIRIQQHEDEIREITITGHAGTADHGHDLVCAAVSAVSFGILNALDELAGTIELSAVNNKVHIKADGNNPTEQIILKTGIIQLKTIQESNQESIKIYQSEV